jgi:hypothetical protein
MALIRINIWKIFPAVLGYCLLCLSVLAQACTSFQSPAAEAPLLTLKERVEPLRLWVPGESSIGDGQSSPGALTAFASDAPRGTVSEADLFHWHQQPIGDLAGRCRRLDGIQPSPAVRTVRLEADLPRPEESAGKVFFVLPTAGKEVLGFGVFDDNGVAECLLRPEQESISTSSGEARVETLVTILPKNALAGFEVLKVRVRRKGQLVVAAGAEQGIFVGDMIRIGRLPMIDGSLLYSDAVISRELNSDLFKSVVVVGENLGVTEYLVPTLFVGRNPLEIDLDEGTYKLAILRSGRGDTCVTEVEVRSERATFAACEVDTQAAPEVYAEELDATNLSGPMRDAWESSEIMKLKGVRFLRRKEFLPPDLSANFVPMLDAEGTIDPEGFCQNAIKSFKNFRLVLAGTGERLLGRGATPFLTLTRGASNIESEEMLQNAFYTISNGVSAEFVGASPSLLWPLPAQQKVRAYLNIPRGNATNVAAFYVNGRERKRVAVPRSSRFDAAKFLFEYYVPSREDYEFSVCAWGMLPLPEFITGTRRALPLFVSRSVCVDVDGDGRCQILNQGE